MLNQFSRTALIYGDEAMERLKNARVAVFGLGGVGGHAAEALARSGVGALDLIDNDTVSMTNINRQTVANLKTVGLYKTEVMKERIADINPDACVKTYNTFYSAETAGDFDLSVYDYIIDAIDTVSAKILLIVNAESSGVPIISSMGAGNKTDASAFEVADIYKTSVCPLARVMRTELKKRGVKALKVIYSKEPPIKPTITEGAEKKGTAGRQAPGSTAFCPSVAGLIAACEVVNFIAK